ncbi:unnamed protein product [Echinostoma caproni]|uniref:Transmembrane protein n=1 Tax=Echinostoma caproni TaxID=27848 RepID=A0A183AK18_9TREM|nr:unnamed protein product [Echinostoma caproni]
MLPLAPGRIRLEHEISARIGSRMSSQIPYLSEQTHTSSNIVLKLNSPESVVRGTRSSDKAATSEFAFVGDGVVSLLADLDSFFTGIGLVSLLCIGMAVSFKRSRLCPVPNNSDRISRSKSSGLKCCEQTRECCDGTKA